MVRIKHFFSLTFLGGFLVVLPLIALTGLSTWIFNLIAGTLSPIASYFETILPINNFIADLLSMALIIVLCFVIGLFISTRVGKFLFDLIEINFLNKLPGYKILKDTSQQFFGNQKAPFSKVAFVKLFETETKMTGFVTDEHADGTYTVFVPTGPNPTSGLIYHLTAAQVEITNASVEEAMKTIISCGAGTESVMKNA